MARLMVDVRIKRMKILHHTRTSWWALLAVMIPVVVFSATTPEDAVLAQWKTSDYDTRYAWLYAAFTHRAGVPMADQRIQVIFSLRSPEMRADIAKTHPRQNHVQFLISTNGASHYSSSAGFNGDEAKSTSELLSAITTVGRLLAWPTNATYRLIAPRNRMDVKLPKTMFTLRLDENNERLVSCKIHSFGRLADQFSQFQFDTFRSSQGLLYPTTWHYSSVGGERLGTLTLDSLSLFMTMDESCFTSGGLSHALRDYVHTSRAADNRIRVAAVHLTAEQQQAIATGLSNFVVRAQEIEVRFADNPDEQNRAGQELMTEWRDELKKIKEMSGRSDNGIEE